MLGLFPLFLMAAAEGASHLQPRPGPDAHLSAGREVPEAP